MKYITASELNKVEQKLIDDPVEALAVVRMAKVRFGFCNTFLDFTSEKIATTSFDFLKSLGFKVRYYAEGGKKAYRATKTLEVQW